jgi:hypothetical protein
MKEPHQNTVGSREKSVRPSTSPEPAPTRAIPKDISSRGSLELIRPMPLCGRAKPPAHRCRARFDRRGDADEPALPLNALSSGPASCRLRGRSPSSLGTHCIERRREAGDASGSRINDLDRKGHRLVPDVADHFGSAPPRQTSGCVQTQRKA